MELTPEFVLSLFEQTSLKIAETSQKIAETNRSLDRLSRKVESISDTLGKFAEESIEPVMSRLFKEKGIFLQEVAKYVVKHGSNGDFLYEIDLLAVNGEYGVVAEVKTTLRKDDIDEFLERIIKIQSSPIAALYGKTIYGAIGAMIASDEVCRYAAKKGLFVLVQSGDNVKIDNDVDFVGKTWAIPALSHTKR